MKNVPSNLSNLKSKVHKLDVDKLVPVPVDLSKISDVVKNDAVKKDVYNAELKNIVDKIPDITNLTTNTTLNAKIKKAKGEIPDITNLANTTAVENKIPTVSFQSRKRTITEKLVKLKIKLLLIIVMINILLFKNLVT